jgi:hypothetical protein
MKISHSSLVISLFVLSSIPAQSMVTLSLDFSDPNQLSQLEARDSHNDFTGWDTPSISGGTLNMQQTLIDTGLVVGDDFSLSLNFSFTGTGGVRHFIQLGVVTEYSTYSDSGGTIHEGGPGQLFGPGTQYSIMVLDNSSDIAQIRDLKSWASESVVASSSTPFVANQSYHATLTGSRPDELSPHTLDFSISDIGGSTIFSTSRTDYLAANGRLAFSGLTNPLSIDQMTAFSSVPEPKAYSLFMGFISAMILSKRRWHRISLNK